MARKSEEKTEELTPTVFTVTARQPVRWRSGMQFGAEPRDVELTQEQAEAIFDDPLLVIVPKAAGSE